VTDPIRADPRSHVTEQLPASPIRQGRPGKRDRYVPSAQVVEDFSA